MPLILDVIVTLGLASALAGAVRLWRRSLAVGRREDLQALAARRGWSLTVTGERLGREGALRLSPRGGHPWALAARKGANGPVAVFEAGWPRWPEGTLVATMAPQTSDSRAVHRALGPEGARLARSLKPTPAPPGLLTMSSTDPAPRVGLDDVAGVLASWTAPGRPILILSPEGLSLSLSGTPRADRMERLVDLALDLSRVIGPQEGLRSPDGPPPAGSARAPRP